MRMEYFSEEELRAAAEKVRNTKLGTISDEPEAAAFSAEFEDNIRKLFKREKRARIYRTVRKYVAAAVLVLVAGVSLLLTFSSDARAAIKSWFKNGSKIHTLFWFDGEKKSEELPFYEPDWIPEGFQYDHMEMILVDITVDENGNQQGRVLNRRLIYTCTEDSTKELMLRYGFMQEDDSVHIIMNDAEYETKPVNINGLHGELYISQDAQVSSAMAWFDEEQQVYFLIIAHLTPEEMIELAESVRMVD